MRNIVLFVAASILAISPLVSVAQDRGDEVFVTPTGDPEMEAARRHARDTLNSFFETERMRPSGTSGFKLKVKFSDGSYTEHFWVQSIRATSTGYEGLLANEPKYVKTVQLGQMVRFTRNDITDWGYVKNGRQVGSFTVCALFKRAPKEQVEYYRTHHGFDC